MAKYNRYIKMALYGQPGVGKSTFVSKAPNVLILATDGNAEWLDLPEENSIQLQSWNHAIKVFSELNTPKYDKFDTIAVDLLEDLYSWCEQDVLKKFKIDHLSDLPFGKAYDDVRKNWFSQVSKLFTLKKHIVLIMHEITKVEKDRRGVETYRFYPTNVIPLDKKYGTKDVEGKTRYFLRAYIKAEEGEGGKLLKKRYLSICPKENEFGISRGFDENNAPEDIPLDWNAFCNIIGVKKISDDNEVQPTTMKSDVEESVVKPAVTPKVVVSKPVTKPTSPIKTFVPLTEAISSTVADPVVSAPTAQPAASPAPAAKPAESQADKLARIRAMLANRK